MAFGALGSLVVSLNANIAKFEEAMNKASYIANKNMREIRTSVDAIPGSIARLATSTAGIYAMARGFKAAIDTVDEYRVSVIGIAATLTDLSKPGQGDMSDVFRRNKGYAEEMYKAISVESAKHFATASDMMTVYNRLVLGGYAATLQEVGAIGLLADKIKLATRGQDAERQLNTEIMALMEGQARAGSLIALELKSRLGPGWADLVEKHKQAGDFLSWIISLYPGLLTANRYIQETLNSQWATLKSQLELLAIGGLGGAYKDIVDFVRSINDYLREHGNELAGKIKDSWETIRQLIKGTYEYFAGIYKIASTAVTWTIKIAVEMNEVARMALSILHPEFRWAPGGAMKPGMFHPSTRGWAGGLSGLKPPGDVFEGYEVPEEGLRTPYGAKPPEVMGRKPEIGKGGGGGKDIYQQLEDYILQLREDLPKAAGEGFGAVDAWYNKAINKIQKLATTQDQLDRAIGTANEVKAAKNKKVEEDFTKWYLEQTGQQTKAELLELEKRLASVKGHAAQETQVRAVQAYKQKEQQLQLTSDIASQEKRYIDSLAGILPGIDQQNALKRISLDLEQKIADIELDRWLLQHDKIPAAIKDEIRALAALEAQAKKTNLSMQAEESKGTLTGWASARLRESQNQKGQGIAGLLTGAENFFEQAMSAGIQGVLTKDTKKLKQVGETMLAGFIGQLHKRSITAVFDKFAEMIAPKEGMGGRGANMQTAAVGLNKAAKGLQGSAGGFDANAMQFGLAAGGLLLSGIGIMTNSQALVIAGTVLQLAAMAIQTYQMLSATSSSVALITAAGSLEVAAGSLMVAATALGGGAGGGVGGILGQIGGGILGMFGFHQGGLITAHSGYLANDERIIKVQTGERILNRRETQEYESGRKGNGGSDNNTINIFPRYPMSRQETEYIVRTRLIPALAKERKRAGGRYL